MSSRKQLNIRLKPDLLEAFQAHCDDLDVTPTIVVSDLIRSFLGLPSLSSGRPRATRAISSSSKAPTNDEPRLPMGPNGRRPKLVRHIRLAQGKWRIIPEEIPPDTPGRPWDNAFYTDEAGNFFDHEGDPIDPDGIIHNPAGDVPKWIQRLPGRRAFVNGVEEDFDRHGMDAPDED